MGDGLLKEEECCVGMEVDVMVVGMEELMRGGGMVEVVEEVAEEAAGTAGVFTGGIIPVDGAWGKCCCCCCWIRGTGAAGTGRMILDGTGGIIDGAGAGGIIDGAGAGIVALIRFNAGLFPGKLDWINII
jgi:hypothetical protein